MTFIEKAGLVIFVLSAIVLFGGSEISDWLAAFAYGMFMAGTIFFLFGADDEQP